MKYLSYLVVVFLFFSTALVVSSCDDGNDEPKSFTVSFETDGGTSVADQTVTSGSKVTKPADPTKPGHSLVAWYKETGFTTEWNFDSDVVNADITLYAKWEQNTYTVTFNSNDGSAVAAQTVAVGGKATEPSPVPTKEGYIFDGWYTDNNTFRNKWNFAANTVTASITLFSKWIENEDDTSQKITSISGTVVGDFDDYEYDEWYVGISFDTEQSFEQIQKLTEDMKFHFDLPENPDEKYLQELDGSGYEVSAQNVKLCMPLINMNIIDNDDFGSFRGMWLFSRAGQNKVLQYFYVNKDVEINGSVEIEEDWYNTFDGVKLKKGWNIVIQERIATGNVYTNSSTIPDADVWTWGHAWEDDKH